MIKLQREVKEKSTKFLMLQEKYSMLEEVIYWMCTVKNLEILLHAYEIEERKES